MVTVFINGHTYSMRAEDAENFLKSIGTIYQHGIYAIRKRDFIECTKLKHQTKQALLDDVCYFENQGYKVYWNWRE